MAVRERINRVKIEHWRLSRVPIDSTETIYQGDLLVWSTALKLATKATATSAATFVGMSDTTNPIETIGSTRFLSDSAKGYVNVIQAGLVELVAGTSQTIFGFDEMIVGADAQTTVKGTTNPIGFADPGWAGSAGKAVVAGDLVKVWLRIPKAYNSTAQT